MAHVLNTGKRLKAMLLGSGDRKPDLLDRADEFRSVLNEFVEVVCEDFSYESSLDDVEADMAIVLGGDGSILRAAKQMGHRQVPVLGINLGRLGFLAALQPEDLRSALSCLESGKYEIVDHLMMQVQVHREGKVIAEGLGLNEAAILGGPPFDIQHIDLFVDGKLATTYSCDGLIISTPVGSTAHARRVDRSQSFGGRSDSA